MSPADLKGFTPAGREQLRSVLERVLRANQVRTRVVPEALLERALAEDRGLELVRHLDAVRKDGGRV
jgi:hypothetical protein